MKLALRSVLSLWILLLLGHWALAQTRIVTGKVTDNNNQPVIGASVLVRGTTTGTYTDLDGNFSLAVPENATTLTVKYLGMRSQDITIGTGPVNVTLQPDVLGLEEVVVTAVGISRERKSLGYAVQGVSGDDLTHAGENNTLQALSGKVAGLQVIQSSGTPGGATFMRLRGATSLTGTNSPLIIVDGIPLDNSENYSGNPDEVSGLINNNALQNVNNSNRGIDINPDDIENITVLKGPAATALYGINASNGAIVITTKKGGARPGAGLSISYSTNVTIETVSQLPELQNEFVKGNGSVLGPLSAYTANYPSSWGPRKDTLFWNGQANPFNQHGEIIGATEAAGVSGAIPFEAYDNLGDFFQPGRTWDNNLALSGGSGPNYYRFSFSALNQDGVVPLSTFNRYTGKISGGAALSRLFNASGSVTYVNSGGRRMQQGSNLSGLMLDLLRTPISFQNSGGHGPTDTAAFMLPDGRQRNYRGGLGYDNPYWSINMNPFEDDLNRMYGFGQLDFLPVPWLTITYRLGSDFYNDSRTQFYAMNSRAYPTGRIYEQNWFYRHINSDLLFNFSRRFSDEWSGTLTLGHNAFSRRREMLYTQGDNFIFAGFAHIEAAANVLSRQQSYQYRTHAGLMQGSLGFRDQLYLNVTARNEWTSTLAPGNNSFFYPSVSLSWLATETFGMTQNSWLPLAKFRISYAQVGKDAGEHMLGNYFAAAVASDGWTYGVPFPVDGIVGYASSATLGNPDLKAEQTSSFEIGAELRGINNRVGLDLTYYTSVSRDQIIIAPIAQSTGYQYMVANTGRIDNRGIELQFTATPIKHRDFEWNIGLNWARNRSEVVFIAEGVNELFMGGFEGSAIYAVVGEQYGSIYGTRWLRNSEGKVVIDDRQFLPDGSPNPDYGYPIQDPQTGVVGNVNPDWTAGLSNSFSFRNVTFNILFDMRQGGDIWNGTRGALNVFGMAKETEDRGSAVTFDGVLGHLNEDGILVGGENDNNIEVVKDQGYYSGIGGGFGGPMEQFVEDGSFIKLREVSLYYDFTPRLVNRTPFRSLSVGFVGRNLWVQTKYSGVDPETSLTGSLNSTGMDYFNMPGTRSFGFSLRVGL